MTTPEDTGETYSITIKGEIYLLISQYMSNPPIFLMNEIDNLITLHTQKAETKARIDEHSQFWGIVPPFAEHIGTVKDISDLRVLKLEAQLTNPTEAGEK